MILPQGTPNTRLVPGCLPSNYPSRRKRRGGLGPDNCTSKKINSRSLQLGDRLKGLRKAQRLGTVEFAARAGITRNTLRAVESGDPAPSMGTYL